MQNPCKQGHGLENMGIQYPRVQSRILNAAKQSDNNM